MTGVAVALAGMGGGAPGFNPATAIGVLLSQSNHKAAYTASSGNGGARSLQTHSVGKRYFEIQNIDAAKNSDLGFAPPTLATSGDLGGASGGVAARATGFIRVAGVVVIDYGSNLLSRWCALAVDLNARVFWIKIPSLDTNWNRNASADPAIGAGGIDFSGVAGTGVLVHPHVKLETGSMLGNFGRSAWSAGGPPSGYVPWAT